jgi:transcriptional regulator with GAF, ATPase, and Fis domain
MGLLTGNDLTVLITGESGVGKERVARGIHLHSPRGDQPFIAVNCAALPESLLESELFGHEKGAFTGADSRRLGRCEAAGTGTLFLDEIGELPYHLQSKLLRVLQERRFERVGSVTPIPLKARVIAASNRVLEDEVAHGRFRADLYHRLQLLTLTVPPLRQRKEDIPALAEHFLQQANAELGKRLSGLEAAVLTRLHDYDWPGNVRELEHAIKRAALLAYGPLLTVHDVVLKAVGDSRPAGSAWEPLRTALHAALQQALAQPEMPPEGIFHVLVDFTERELIAEALRLTGGNQVAASRLLGLHRTTMRKKMLDEAATD